MVSGANPAPSDFVRTEWIAYKPRRLAKLRTELRASLERIDALSEYCRKIGDVALEADRADLELAFERYHRLNPMIFRQHVPDSTLRRSPPTLPPPCHRGGV